MMKPLILCTLWLSVLTGACVSNKKELTAEEKAKLAAYIAAEVPADATRLDINYDNKLHIVGVKVEPEGPLTPGTEVKLRYYWRCDTPPGPEWLLYTHVLDPATGKIDNLDFSGPIRQARGEGHLFGPAAWESGKIYVDEQTYTVPQRSGIGAELMVRVGLWRSTDDQRLRIVSGPTDGTNGGIVALLPIAGGVATKAKPSIPELSLRKLGSGQTIVVDGKGTDAAWAEAQSTGAFVDVSKGQPNTSFPINAKAKLAWDDHNLYGLVEVSDPDLQGGFVDPKTTPEKFTTAGQPMLWNGHTIELMVDPDGDGDNKDYYEIQINPQNKLFATHYDSYNSPKTDPRGPFGHEDWDPKLTSAVELRGTIDKSDDKDDGYTVEFSIPWSSFHKAKKTPPAHQDSWRINFYAMQRNSGVAWSPILGQGNFHKASRFGRVSFLDEATAQAPSPEIDAGAADAGPAAAGGESDAGTSSAPAGPKHGAAPKNRGTVDLGF